MSYADFLGPARSVAVESSPVESERFGFAIGRLSVGVSDEASASGILSAIEGSRCDLVVVRYPAAESRLGAALLDPEFVSWQADSLLYFSDADSGGPPRGMVAETGICFVDARNTEGDDLRTVITEAFAGYRNHYSANPFLSAVTPAVAYTDWITRVAEVPGFHVEGAYGSEGTIAGFYSVDTRDARMDEHLVGGVRPAARGRGLFPAMLLRMRLQARAKGKPMLVSSTQTSNVTSIRSHLQAGLLPVLAVSTVHVMPRASYDRMRAAEKRQER